MLQNQSKPSPPTQAYHAPDLQVRSSTLLSGGLQLPLWFPAHTHRDECTLLAGHKLHFHSSPTATRPVTALLPRAP